MVLYLYVLRMPNMHSHMRFLCCMQYDPEAVHEHRDDRLMRHAGFQMCSVLASHGNPSLQLKA